jgi:hypothetical protein
MLPSKETPYERLIKRDAADRLGWLTQPAIKIFLNEKKREHLATRGGLRGADRDSEACLARVIDEMIEKDMEAR